MTITGVAAGTAVITVSVTVNGKTYTAECTVTVTETAQEEAPKVTVTVSNIVPKTVTGSAVTETVSAGALESFTCTIAAETESGAQAPEISNVKAGSYNVTGSAGSYTVTVNADINSCPMEITLADDNYTYTATGTVTFTKTGSDENTVWTGTPGTFTVTSEKKQAAAAN